MKKKNLKQAAISMGIVLGLSVTLGGCGQEDESQVSLPNTESMTSVSDLELMNTEGKVQSDLTGE